MKFINIHLVSEGCSLYLFSEVVDIAPRRAINEKVCFASRNAMYNIDVNL